MTTTAYNPTPQRPSWLDDWLTPDDARGIRNAEHDPMPARHAAHRIHTAEEAYKARVIASARIRRRRLHAKIAQAIVTIGCALLVVYGAWTFIVIVAA